MASTIKVGGTDVSIPGVGFSQRVQKAKNNNLLVSAGINNKNTDEIRVQLADSNSGNNIAGKPYPGYRMDFATAREVARASTVIASIVKLRIQQVAMLPIKIVPAKKEPTRQVSILKYGYHELDNHPAFDDSDKSFLRDVYERLDPQGTKTDKRDEYEKKKESVLTKGDVATIDYLQDKHDDFYRKRAKDMEDIEKLLKNPDSRNTMTKSWNSLIYKIGEDLIILDRAVLIKVRDTSGKIRHLMPVDGATIRPVVDEYGYNGDFPYVQSTPNGKHIYLKGEDVIVMMMNPLTDSRFFGYGLSPMETLYNVVLSDLFIDKGNIDYYRKGGSIPEGFISVEPPASKEGQINVVDQEQLDAIQRQLQSIIMSDFTQIPIVSGGKFSWTDFKGSRRDMQFQELADYVIRKICSVLQVSPQDVGLIDGIRQSDAEVQADLTKSKGLKTIMSVISEFITQEVIQELRPEGDLKLWYEEPEDKEADKNWGTQAKLQAGYLSINEARQDEGRASVPWGDTPLQGLSKNWAPLDPNDPGLGGGLGGPGGLPPIPGMSPPPVPGGSPPSAPPPPLALKSYNQTVFDTWESDVNFDVSPLVDVYLKSSRFSEDEDLKRIKNYKPSRSYTVEYEELGKKLDISLPVMKSADREDFLMYGAFGKPSENIIQGMVREFLSKDNDKTIEIRKSFGAKSGEAVEYAFLAMIESQQLRDKLNNSIYQYKRRSLNDSEVQEVLSIIAGK